MDVGGPASVGAQEEVLVPGLAWGMRNISSMITRRDEVVVHAQPGEYTPETSRLIRLHLSSANQWVQLSTVRLVMEIHNTSLTAPLEFLVPCNAIFSSSRLLSQGTVVDQLDFLPRLAQVLNCTLPESALQLNGQEQFKKLPLKEPNADGRYML